MDYALMVEPQVGGTYEDLLDLARWAQHQGLVAIARSDHYLDQEVSAHATDAFATLAGLARDTEQILLTVLVTPITFRHPAVIAKTAATIDEMSGGRLELGVGTGWMETEHEQFGMDLMALRERFSRLYESLAYISAAFGRTEGGYAGRHYSLDPIEVLPRPTGRIPIIVGGNGPNKTPTIAGRFGDEYNSFVDDAAGLRRRMTVLRDAASESGRDPDEILVSTVLPLFFGADEADYREVMDEAAMQRDTTRVRLEERLSDRSIPFGTAERLAEWAEGAAALGVGRIYIQAYKHLAAIDTSRLERLLGVALS